jgi:hypothetical protein
MSPRKRGAQELTHISQEHLAVHGPVGDHRCGQLAVSQSAHKCRGFPMPVRRRVEAATPSGGPSVAARHAGRSPRFIDEHEPFDFHRG